MTDNMTIAAKEYTARGWVVHPLSKPNDGGNSPGKIPVINGWQRMTSTPEDIGAYINKGYNLGLVCGRASGVDALDLDIDVFMDELLRDVDINTLISGHRKGRGHILFQHEDDMFSEKHHFIGIEYFGNNGDGAGGNLVLPPSIHYSGEVYKWLNPDAPLMKMPDKLKANIRALFQREEALHGYFKKCRRCFTSGSKKYGKEDPRSKGIWDRPDDIAIHDMDGRRAVLAIMGELKAAGCPDELLHMACKRFFGKDYNYETTDAELKHVEPIHPTCETLRQYLNVECDGCTWKPTKTKPVKKDKISYGEVAGQICAKYPIITLRDNPDEMYYYENGVYKYGAESIIREEAQKILGDDTSTGYIHEIVFYIQNSTFIDRNEINNEKHIINLENGLYDIRTKVLEPHRASFISTCRIPIKYNPDATCPEIAKFLCEILRPMDIALILQLFGYCMVPDYTIQKAIMWNGSGMNGKGTLGRLLGAFLGEKNTCCKSLKSLNTDKFAVASLYGKLVNIDTDLTDAAINEDSMFKKLTGGDDIDGERKFQNSFTFKNTARCVFGANEIPPHPKGGYAWARRWVIIDFPVKFDGKQEDKSLDDKLQTPEELSELLNLCLTALDWLMETKTFFYDKTPEEVGDEYLLKSNSVMAFMAECTTAADDYVRTSDLYQAYCAWAKAKELKKIEGINIVGRLLKNGGYIPSRPFVDGKQVHCYEGFVIDYDKLVGLQNRARLFENHDAYTHWFAKDSEISRVSRDTFQIMREIINYCMCDTNVSNEKICNNILSNYLGHNPTNPTNSETTILKTDMQLPKTSIRRVAEQNPSNMCCSETTRTENKPVTETECTEKQHIPTVDNTSKPRTVPTINNHNNNNNLRDFGLRAKDWIAMHGQAITTENKVEVAMWIAASIATNKVLPSDVVSYLEKEYALTPAPEVK